jgi:hypothetical protein
VTSRAGASAWYPCEKTPSYAEDGPKGSDALSEASFEEDEIRFGELEHLSRFGGLGWWINCPLEITYSFVPWVLWNTPALRTVHLRQPVGRGYADLLSTFPVLDAKLQQIEILYI